MGEPRVRRHADQEQSGAEQPDQRPDEPDVASAAEGKRKYHTPILTEYGSVAKLTHSGGSTTSEGPTPNAMACL